MEEINLILEEAEEAMNKSISHLSIELSKIRAGRANPSMLDSVKVDYYGTPTPLAQVGNVSTLDSRTLNIQPWEKGMLEPISKAIIDSNLGLNPQNNGDVIIISIPALTEERRRDLSKQAKAVGEDAKVAIRSARKSANDGVKSLKDDGLPEDVQKSAEIKVQDITNEYVAKVDSVIAAKEKDIMTV